MDKKISECVLTLSNFKIVLNFDFLFMVQSVDQYLVDGCMRCKYGATPECKVHSWSEILVMLRHLALQSGLAEQVKWGVPCYTYQGKNVFNISAFKNFACIGFFKGVLLSDPDKILEKQGENSQSGRIIKFTSADQVSKLTKTIASYFKEAIEIEKSGKMIEAKKEMEAMPEELHEYLEQDELLKNAFYSLTPGRQRGYIIYFSQPKQSASRINRIEKCKEKILNGEGLHDKYNS